MTGFIAANWVWILLVVGMLTMHLGHRGHGGGGCGGHAGHQGHAGHTGHTGTDAHEHAQHRSPGEQYEPAWTPPRARPDLTKDHGGHQGGGQR